MSLSKISQAGERPPRPFDTAAHFLRRHGPALAGLAAAVVTALVFLLSVPARFETDDDLAMAEIAYGVNGQYSSYLIFINVALGWLLKVMILLLPQLSWYMLFQAMLILLSFAALFYLLFRRFGLISGLFPAVLLAVFFGYQFFSRVQFSKTAGITAVAGLLLLFDAVEREERRWPGLLAGAGLVIAGSLYRFNAFGMVCILLFGVGLQLLWRRCKTRDVKAILRLCLPFVVVFALCFGLHTVDNWLYQSTPEWAAYAEFNSLRAELLDYGFPDYEENAELYEELGITENDIRMYSTWEIGDTERFNVETMRRLVEAKATQTVDSAFFSLFFDEMYQGFARYWYTWAGLLAVLCCLLSLDLRRLFILLYEIAALVLLELYLYYRGRYLLNRIDVCIVLSLTMVLLLYGCGEKPWRRQWVAAGLAAALLLCYIPRYQDAREVQLTPSTAHYYTLFSGDQEHLYLSTGIGVPADFSDMWRVPSFGSRSNFIKISGWRTSSPHLSVILDRYGITNPYRELVDNPSLYLICPEDTLEQKLTYIREHYTPEANAYCVRLIDNMCPVYRIATSEPELDTRDAIPVAAGEQFQIELTWEPTPRGIRVQGRFQGEGIDSFAASIYLGICPPDGEEQLYYTTQILTHGQSDELSGDYASFLRWLGPQTPGSTLRLYLETSDALYRAETGVVLPEP